jgi:putative cell wall-binding protein
MTRPRPLPFLAALATAALLATLTSAPAAARTTDEPITPELSAATSGAVTGRVLIVPFGGGSPVPANSGEVQFFSQSSPVLEPAATAFLTPSGTFSLNSGLPAGQYSVAFISRDTRAFPVREWFNNQFDLLGSDTVTLVDDAAFPFGDVVLEQRTIVTERLAGANRYATAAAVSERYAIDGAVRDIVIVNGQNFPDALGAGPIASRFGGPLLMVTTNAIPADTVAELERLTPRTITIVGGTGVVSAAVEAQLATYVGGAENVTRIAGANRYATSRAVVQALDTAAPINELFIATGRGFPDALAAVPAAGSVGGAVLLVNGALGSLDSTTAAFIDGLDVPVTIVGGTGVVSAGIQNQLSGRGIVVNRVSGSTRYTTAIAIAIEYFPYADYAYLANGRGFADALAIGPWGGAYSTPVYLTQPDCVTDAVFDDLIDGLFSGVSLVGGTGVLSTTVEDIEPCTTS